MHRLLEGSCELFTYFFAVVGINPMPYDSDILRRQKYTFSASSSV
jgi:hypothetical protein